MLLEHEKQADCWIRRACSTLAAKAEIVGASVLFSRGDVRLGGFSLPALEEAISSGHQSAWAFYLDAIETINAGENGTHITRITVDDLREFVRELSSR